VATLFSLQIHTPYRLFFSGQVEAFTVTLADGEIGVRAHRSPFAAPLRVCIIKILDEQGAWKQASLTEGVIEVTDKGATILTGAAEWPEEIDRERAEKAKNRAEERLGEPMLKFETSRAHASLDRAMNRLRALV